ncbi:MAG TPA: hydroxypyruvate isomerase, partial [Flavisolibacter sp.]
MLRRNLLKSLVLSGTAVAASPSILLASCNPGGKNTTVKGNINHSVCRWTYNFLSLEELCQTVKTIGFSAIDLVGPKE